jgi:hypothetical protein
MAALSLHRIASLLLDVTEPLRGRSGPSRKDIDSAVKNADGQASSSAAGSTRTPAGAVEARLAPVAAIASTGQVVRLFADPPVCWDSSAEAWTCPEATTLSVTFSDGDERAFRYPAGTIIPVAAGLIHFPLCAPEA